MKMIKLFYQYDKNNFKRYPVSEWNSTGTHLAYPLLSNKQKLITGMNSIFVCIIVFFVQLQYI